MIKRATGLVLALILVLGAWPLLAEGPEVIHVRDDIDGDQTWTADAIYVIDQDVTVMQGVTLRIGAGTIVKLADDADLIIEGALQVNEPAPVYWAYLPLVMRNALGGGEYVGEAPPLLMSEATVPAPDALVIFTSLADDTVGGDTNEDGDASEPAVGDWGGIRFEAGSNDDDSYMRRFVIRYSGNPRSSLTAGAILLDNASPSLIRDATLEHNHLNGIEIPRSQWQSDHWGITDLPYCITGDVTVPRGNRLSIGPGVVCKFAEGKQIKVLGTLDAIGTASRPVLMTSLLDDSALGDSNGDGDASEPAVKDWGGIAFDEDSQGDPGTLNHVEIRYSGQSIYPNVAAIQLDNCSPLMNNVTFVDSYINGATLTAYSNDLDSLALLSSDVPYIIQTDLNVPQAEILTIGPGVNLKLARNASLHVSGVLQAVGSESQPIVFTSDKDDSALGDSNNDAQRSSPNAGDWGCVFFADASDDTRCTMSWVALRHGGRDGLQFSSRIGGIRLDNASPVLEHIAFEDCEVNAVEIPEGDWRTDTWDNTGVVYFVSGDLRVPAGETLTVAPGVMIKVVDPVTVQTPPEITIEGDLRMGDALGDPVLITSGLDDEHGPAEASNWDSNNDATASAPEISNWAGITFAAGSGGNSHLTNVTVLYGGIRQGTFVEGHGALRLQSASPALSGCRFQDNYVAVECLSGAQPTITGCSLLDSESYGVYTDTPGQVVQAVNNWWGASTGPRSDGSAGNTATGNGDMVSEGVAFTPWLAAAP